jgi:methyltransferase-like protein/protein-L-isoaspartate O-methyltransferase
MSTETSPSPTTYDRIPYHSRPFPQTHPDTLFTIGRLFGLAARPVTDCRTLELGCAAGGNLIPMAFHLPSSRFVGVDASKTQIEAGQKTIRDLNLSNIRLVHADILDIDASWGTFDYIITHGVYSWVPDPVQEKILSISSENLADNGIAYISYNTYPGCHIRDMVRQMMLYHTRQFDSPQEQIEQARALLTFLSTSVPVENNPFGMLLKRELDLIQRVENWYLFHDHLEDVNTPVYFHQFMERARAHSLKYLGEADFSAMMTAGFSPDVADTLNRITSNITQIEQYMDFLRNRQFRQTLLCRQDIPLRRDLGPERIFNFQIASPAYPETMPVDLTPGVPQRFRIPYGATVTSSASATKAAYQLLHSHWPKAMDLKSLSDQVRLRLIESEIPVSEEGSQDQLQLAADLLHCYSLKGLCLHSWQADMVNAAGDHPRISEVARYQAEKGENRIVNQRHETVSLDAFSSKLVPLLNGQRTREELLARMIKLRKDGALVVKYEESVITEENELRSAFDTTLTQALEKLARAALLVA